MKVNDDMRGVIMLLNQDENQIIHMTKYMEAGITKDSFYRYIKENNYEKVGHGIYASKEAWIDEYYILHLRSKSCVFSHETALYLHGLIDREPIQMDVTLKTGYNPNKLKQSGIKVYTIKSEYHDMGKVDMETPYGNIIPAYDLERTICDLIRSRKKIEAQSIQTAMKNYADRPDKNIRKLLKYGKMLRVDNVLRQYLEVLL